MLLKIREKSQGVFSWVILLLICIPFALWGIQNYLGGGSEAAVASVGDKEFFQQDVNRAYAQFSQSLAGTNFDEKAVKQQALQKLIRDEVLLQYVQQEGMVVTDGTTRKFIRTLEYFQTDGKFDKDKYKSLLAAQGITSREFVNRIKKALVMEQFQRSVVDSSFTTAKDLDNFFRIQNQKRDVDVISIPLQKVKEQPTDAEIEHYYQQHKDSFLTPEQISIEYVLLSLDDLAKQVQPTEQQLKTYYEENKDRYTRKERRKISHILFAFTDGDEDKQLQRALKAKQELKNKSFAAVAAAVSDDSLTAKKGGDLGLFVKGDMEKSFEEAASSLKLGEVSDPVKSSFGYHLIKVTELVPAQTKSFDEVKGELIKALKRAEAESTFYELGETLSSVSYENPDSLQATVDALGIDIKKTGYFTKNAANNISDKTEESSIVSQPAVISAAFSEDVLKGNNSEVIELGSDKALVLRMLDYKPAEAKSLEAVKTQIVNTILSNKAKLKTAEKAKQIRLAIISGRSIKDIAKEYGLTVQHIESLSRSDDKLGFRLVQAIFKAAKPVDGKPTVKIVENPSGTQTVVSLLAVKEGTMTVSDKAKKELAEKNLARVYGQAEYNAAINSMEKHADITIRKVE